MKEAIIGGVIAFSMLWPTSVVAPSSTQASSTKTCERTWHSSRRYPDEVRIWVPHLHRIVVFEFRDYVLHVMSAGAAPSSLPSESLKVMALAIAQYTLYEVLHPSDDKHKKGGCYDLKNGGSEGQYVWPYSGLKPYTKRQERAYDAIAGWTLWKRHHGVRWLFRPGWVDGYSGECKTGIDRWRVPEDEVTQCAKKGWGWKRIIRTYLDPVIMLPPLHRNRSI
jgi:hypothetical protein